jgi:predicted enzyme related to lactoylglutathione lyase
MIIYKLQSNEKLTLIPLTTGTSFWFGFPFKIIQHKIEKLQKMKKVTGIGGIFFKCKDPKKVTEWYEKHLGLNTNPYGAEFEWYEASDNTKKGTTQWTPFPETTKYFEPSPKDFMINYRVENLVELVEQLKKEGVTIADNIETVDFGKFVHIIDVEGNKVQLWEPTD